ncbi:MAG: amidophosphoribosyltransferase [Cellvibrionales bacterium]|nr:amidophosphoribosyltransferase [Cellvibrionales bacterium]
MCGLVGIYGQQTVGQRLYEALTVLQHRGQDAAGIITGCTGRFHQKKGNGLVRDVFTQADMDALVGSVGIGHCRYPTAGSSGAALAQPFYVNSPFGISLAHNGNLTNAAALASQIVRRDKRHLNTDSDSEVLLNVLAHELGKSGKVRLAADDLFAAVARLHEQCTGAYACVGLIAGQGLLAFRDPLGIRPLVLGRRDHPDGPEYMLASESAALAVLRFECMRDVQPGEAIFIDQQGQLHTRQCATEPRLMPCIFEHVYLARPDSTLDQIHMYKTRLRQGVRLAEKLRRTCPNHDIDVVIPIPDTSRVAAQALAESLGLRLREGLMKNRYIGRTFIMPGQTVRQNSVRQKLNAIAPEFAGRNVLLVDDSIVRGTTSKQIAQMAREAGAAKVYLASAAPPVRHPNVYGIDMPCAAELIAHGRSTDEVAALIGVDWLIYQDIDDLLAASRHGNPAVAGFECSVFTGEYITGGVERDYLDRLDAQRKDEVRCAPCAGQSSVVGLHNRAAQA